jgi:regulator of CtrA degradation
MSHQASDSVDQIYAEAQRLADAARGYFDGPGVGHRAALDAQGRTVFATESLAITARLIAIISWGLLRQAVMAGEIPPARAADPRRRLGNGMPADADLSDILPRVAHAIAVVSRDLFARALAADAAINA